MNKDKKKQVKKIKKKPSPKKCMKKVYRVAIKYQYRDFGNQKEAREWARIILQNEAVYYMSMTEEEVEGC